MRKLGQAFALVWGALALSLALGAPPVRADEPARLRSVWKPPKPPVVLTTGSTRTGPPEDRSRRGGPPFEPPADEPGAAALPGLRGSLSPEEPRL